MAEKRCGYVALIGAPNAGKSTLLNQLIGVKISIVTRKVQTTRTRITAIGLRGKSQVVFVDTPGIFVPKRRLDRAMVSAAWAGVEGADLVVLLIDSARGIDPDSRNIIAGLQQAKRNAIVVLNKTDTVKKEILLALAQELSGMDIFKEIFMVSALKGDGTDKLYDYMANDVPEGPWLYPEDQLADISERLLASEITREKLYLRLHQELPYASTVETESWEDRKDGSVRIGQVIFVRRDTQKSIVLGKGGQTIKAIGAESRKDLEEILDRKVHLFLFVKVRKDWEDDPERYREMGLEFPSKA